MTYDQSKLNQLRKLQAEANRLRRELGISRPDEVIYSAPLDLADETVVVEADGLGGATLKVVEGNYPIDYLTKLEQLFGSEESAQTAAEELITT